MGGAGARVTEGCIPGRKGKDIEKETRGMLRRCQQSVWGVGADRRDGAQREAPGGLCLIRRQEETEGGR